MVALLESLTGTAPSVGFVHGMLSPDGWAARRGTSSGSATLITLALCGVLRRDPAAGRRPHPAALGKKKAERYLLVACTELYTHYLLGDRSLDHVQGLRAGRAGRRGDRARPIPELRLRRSRHAGPPVCTEHLLRDLDDAAQVYPDSIWPVQIADALRALIGEANLARDTGHDRDPR